MELGQLLHHHDMVLETRAIHVGDEAHEVALRAAQAKARNQVKDSNHSSSTRAFAVLSAKESILNDVTIRSRAAARSCGSWASLRAICSSPSARTCASCGATTTPVSPTIIRESPTSVTTQGTPHAIASRMTLEVPSERDEEQ